MPSGDGDCDGWSSPDETVIGTEPTLACGIAAWPPDFNDDQVVNLADILFLAPPVFFSVAPGPPYDVRYDLNLDGVITLSDILYMAPTGGAGSAPGGPIAGSDIRSDRSHRISL